MKLPFTAKLIWLSLALLFYCIGPTNDRQCSASEGARTVNFYGYDDCIRLSNESTSVTLCPAAGGRVLEYAIDGKNVLYLPAGDEGWRYEPGKRRGPMNAGRFDIGPERVVKRGPLLWMGKWNGEITGDRSARLTSQVDPVSGVQLIRDFKLAADSSHLICTQTIDNVSDKPVSLCHWSRTFAIGNGIAVLPRTALGRFPVGYVMYSDGFTIKLKPDDPNIIVNDTSITIKAAPEFPKLGFDSYGDWMAYLAPSNQMFVKRYRAYRDRPYNEVAGLTASVWYPEGRDMVELEPIGPAENLAPGEQGSFTEEWWLIEHPFPNDTNVNPEDIETLVKKRTLPPQ